MRAPLALAILVATFAFTARLPAQDARLVDRLDEHTAAEVSRLVDSARTAGLPAEALLDKALEGATKHAPPTRIIAAVRGLAARLAQARQALGANADAGDLVAAAGALYQGIRLTELAELRGARASGSLAVPLVVLADLIARGVPPSDAYRAVFELTRNGAADESFAALRRDVEHDINAGAPPAIAATTRARGTLFALPALNGGAGARAAGGPASHP